MNSESFVQRTRSGWPRRRACGIGTGDIPGPASAPANGTNPVTTFTYDGFGRVLIVTGPDGYAVTTNYDNFDRPTQITYPDGTFERRIYDRLDLRGLGSILLLPQVRPP